MARERVRALATAGSDVRMQLHAAPNVLFEAADRARECAAYGVNASTLKVDERAWDFWVVVCESQGTTPLRPLRYCGDMHSWLHTEQGTKHACNSVQPMPSVLLSRGPPHYNRRVLSGLLCVSALSLTPLTLSSPQSPRGSGLRAASARSARARAQTLLLLLLL